VASSGQKTHLRPLVRFGGNGKPEYTLLELQLVTGRRHQIRYHCSELGHVLVGDIKYGAPARDRGWCGRVFLHSYRTRLVEPETTNLLEVTAPLPVELVSVLADLSSSSNHVLVQNDADSLLIRGDEQPSLGTFFRPYCGESLLRIEGPDGTWQQNQDLSQPDDPECSQHGGSEDTEKLAEVAGAPLEEAEVETWKLIESRKHPGFLYKFNTATGVSKPVESWKLIQSRTRPGCYYEFNAATGVSQPVSQPVSVKRPCPSMEDTCESPEEEEMIGNWARKRSRRNGHYYFFNCETGKTQWEAPAVWEAPEVDKESAEAAIRTLTTLEYILDESQRRCDEMEALLQSSH